MNLATESLLALYTRDLDKLAEELRLYPSEDAVWKVSHDITNSAGNLSLHLCGNLQHFIGAILGNSGYKRNREDEFSLKNLPRTELLAEIERTKSSLTKTLAVLTPDQLHGLYSVDVFRKTYDYDLFSNAPRDTFGVSFGASELSSEAGG